MAEAVSYRSILLFGMPGSGKGTQGAVLGQLPGMIHISSGDLFRKLPKHGELGREVVSYTSRGLLVPDDLTIRIWKRHIEILRLQEELIPGRTTLILDGLPRNYAQAARLNEVLDVVQILHLCINDIAQARDRLAARALRENRLDDINEEVIQRRFQIYREETEETLRYYKPSIIYDIDAAQTPLKVHTDICIRLCEVEGCDLFRYPPPLEEPEAEAVEAKRSGLTGKGASDRTASPLG